MRPLYSLLFLLFPGCAILPIDFDQMDSEDASSLSSPQSGASGQAFKTPGHSHEPRSVIVSAKRTPIASRSITLGMSMEEVISVWGRPHDVEEAGLAELHNQKWHYIPTPSPEWRLRPERVVYFQQGRVVGWESPRHFP